MKLPLPTRTVCTVGGAEEVEDGRDGLPVVRSELLEPSCASVECITAAHDRHDNVGRNMVWDLDWRAIQISSI